MVLAHSICETQSHCTSWKDKPGHHSPVDLCSCKVWKTNQTIYDAVWSFLDTPRDVIGLTGCDVWVTRPPKEEGRPDDG